jgi:hypothetical protein
MEQAVLPVVVSYQTRRWIKVALRSYRRHFPEGMILVVDNNPKPGERGWSADVQEERAWLKSLPDILLIENPATRKSHGSGLDLAADWARQNGFEFLLHFEPDCLISGRRWYEALRDAVDRGAWMAGSCRRPYGPIHPTPSLWRVDRIESSFEDRVRGVDEAHPRFRELFDLDWLVNAIREQRGAVSWWQTHWDTAQGPWFRAAMHDRTALVSPTNDFHHFWLGSTGHRNHAALVNNPRVTEYLADSIGGLETPPPPPELQVLPPKVHRQVPRMPLPNVRRRPRFGIITPTIPGRERLLRAAIASVQAQDFTDFEQWVVGDGPCPGAEAVCAEMGVHYTSTPSREGTFGASPRNRALEVGDADYFVFLDDDNLMFRTCLARFHEAAVAHGDPPLLAQKILFLPRSEEPFRILPEVLPPVHGRWDQLCACVRGDVARRARFPSRSSNDYAYIMDCIAIADSGPLAVDSIGGVHI